MSIQARPILFDRKDKQGNKQTYATQVNKNGFIYTWEANNGNLITAKKVHPFVNWATSVDLKTGVPVKDARYSTHQDVNTRGVCPTTTGAKGFGAAAYSKKRGVLYIPLNKLCMDYEPSKARYTKGQPWVGASIFNYRHEISKPELGALLAVNSIRNTLNWKLKEAFPVHGGVLVTQTDLVFFGTLERWFKAVDAKTGKLLWKFQLGSGISGNTFTYSNKGKQFIGVLSGMGGWPMTGLLVDHHEKQNKGFDFGQRKNIYYGLSTSNSIPSSGAINIFGL